MSSPKWAVDVVTIITSRPYASVNIIHPAAGHSPFEVCVNYPSPLQEQHVGSAIIGDAQLGREALPLRVLLRSMTGAEILHNWRGP